MSGRRGQDSGNLNEKREPLSMMREKYLKILIVLNGTNFEGDAYYDTARPESEIMPEKEDRTAVHTHIHTGHVPTDHPHHWGHVLRLFRSDLINE